MNDLIMFILSMVTVSVAFSLMALIGFSTYKIIKKYSDKGGSE